MMTKAEASRGRVRCQVDEVRERLTKGGKPFLDVRLRDAEEGVSLKVWGDSPEFEVARKLSRGEFVEVEGEWSNGQYGLECRGWSARVLKGTEVEEVLAGSVAARARQEEDWATILRLVDAMADPRLRGLCRRFLDEFGDRFRRTGAARDYHHARRGGLVEHVGQMMRAANALCGAYPRLNRDLVLAGVLFHDSGKLWENSFPPEGFTMPYHEMGELLGHIAIGMELVNKLWRDLLETPEAEAWQMIEPTNDAVRLHLLHLIGAHHGEQAFGSPVVPKTPEAMALHHIDNIDAKLEMMFRGYEVAPELGRHVQERVRPLPGRLVRPLDRFDDPGGES